MDALEALNEVPWAACQTLHSTGKYADVRFILQDRSGNQVIVPAHKIILAAQSTVFDRMFFGALKEKDQVEITDFCAEAFIEFIRIFYDINVMNGFSEKNMPEVIRLIDKYDIPRAYKIVKFFLTHSVTNANVWNYYEMARYAGLDSSRSLRFGFRTIILRNGNETMKNLAGSEVGAATIKDILVSNHLQCEEVDILNGLMEWAKCILNEKGLPESMENLKAELDDLLELVRFPTMTQQQFLDCAEKYPMLLEFDVFMDILQYVTNQRELTLARNFNTKPRTLKVVEN